MATPDLRAINAYRFRIRLRQPLTLKHQTYLDREGILLEHEGRWAEASPLPGFSRESIDEVIAALRGENATTPALTFALDCLTLPEAAPTEVPYNRLLVDTDDQVAVGAGTIQETRCAAVKLKVGRIGVNDEIHRVRRVREQLPTETGLRLDANRAWTFDEAFQFASAISDLALEYIEEPLRDPQRLEELHQQTGVRYALDESLLDEIDLSQYPGVAALICKPTLLGGRDSIERLSAAGKPLVFSAAFESGVGISRIVQLASMYAPDVAAGLDTLDWLSDDLLIESPVKENGCMRICGEPNVDPSSLERLR